MKETNKVTNAEFKSITEAFAKEINEMIIPVFWEYDEDSYETIFYYNTGKWFLSQGFICSITFEKNTYGFTYETEEDVIEENVESLSEAKQKAKQMILEYIQNK